MVMYVCMSHYCYMQYTRRNNNTTRLLHEIVEIVNHMDDVRRREHCIYSQFMQTFKYIHMHLHTCRQ